MGAMTPAPEIPRVRVGMVGAGFVDHNGSRSSASMLHQNQVWGTLDDWYRQTGAQPGDMVAVGLDPDERIDGLHVLRLGLVAPGGPPTVNATGSQLGLLQAAGATAESLRTAGESGAHRSLKERVAKNPELAGLLPGCHSHIEYRFPSGDRVDVALQYADGRWVMVEVELEGLEETTIGLF